jgi:hypothetical protein
MPDLGNVNGRQIVEVGAILRKTGDGLSETVKVEPDMVLSIVQGDEGYVVFKYRCFDVRHPAEKRAEPAEGGLKRVVELDALTCAFLDEDVVEKAIMAQEERIATWKAEQRGQHELVRAAEMLDAHAAGEHDDQIEPHCALCLAHVAHDNGEHADRLRDPGQCPDCDHERDLVIDEA